MYAIVKKMNEYTSKNRHKYYLKAHLIFVCKYRKQLLKEVILMIQLNPAFLKNPIRVKSASISWNLIRITFIF